TMLVVYAQHGRLTDARSIFEEMPQRDVVSWTALVASNARHGRCEDARRLFQLMELEGELPDEVSFTGILSACCHTGSLDDCWSFFRAMVGDYSIRPLQEHFSCLADALGRAGRLAEAREVVERMPFSRDTATETSLLSANRIHGEV
ncbi:hypothetical protein SELMODRAFT_72290, partial [Selaginella moellendorffii]